MFLQIFNSLGQLEGFHILYSTGGERAVGFSFEVNRFGYMNLSKITLKLDYLIVSFLR